MSNKTIKVWDPLVRIFHWSLVLLFITAYLTGEEESDLHIYSGYAIMGLVFIRIIWGFMGTQYARFSDFIYSPKTVITYLKELLSRNPKHYLGHNPAGGYMVVLLLIMLVITTVTGLKVYGTEGHGPLAANNPPISLISAAIADDDDDDDDPHHQKSEHGQEGDEEAEEFWEEIHEAASNLTVLLILLHILGVIVSSRLHKENLVRAMITGKKQSN